MENLMLPRTLLFELQWLKIKSVKRETSLLPNPKSPVSSCDDSTGTAPMPCQTTGTPSLLPHVSTEGEEGCVSCQVLCSLFTLQKPSSLLCLLRTIGLQDAHLPCLKPCPRASVIFRWLCCSSFHFNRHLQGFLRCVF